MRPCLFIRRRPTCAARRFRRGTRPRAGRAPRRDRTRQLTAPLTIPPGTSRLRVVGDVHGDATAFAYAVQTDRFVVQLGDLVDGGPNSDGVLRLMWQLIDEGRGLFLLGNHDLRLRRALLGEAHRVAPETAATVASLSPAQRARAAVEIARAPAWLVHGSVVFVHGGFHTEMLEMPPPTLPDGRPFGAVARALYGEPTGRTQTDGFPQRSLAWVDRIPDGYTVYCGHDRRSMNGRPLEKHGRRGGVAIFLDTGAGKGGHLSWLDVDLDPATQP